MRPAERKAFRRQQRERVEKALARAQDVCLTSYHLTIEEIPKEYRKTAREECAIFMVTRSGREHQDDNHFVVVYDPDVIATTKWSDLITVAGHEILHMITFSLGELALSGRPEDQQAPINNEIESVTYKLQRIIFGETSE